MTFLEEPILRWGAALVLILGGSGLALYGERNFHFVLGLFGMVAGLVVGYFLTSDRSKYVQLAGMFICGGAGMVLSIVMVYVQLMVVGSYTGMVAVMIVMELLMASWFEVPVPLWQWGVVLLGGIIGGGLALVFRKLLIVLFTSIHGAAAITLGVGMLTYGSEVQRMIEQDAVFRTEPLGTMLWILLSAGACMMQYRYTGTVADDHQRVESYPKRDQSRR